MIQTKWIHRRIRDLRGCERGFNPSQWSIKQISNRLAAVYMPTNEATFNSKANHTNMTLAQMYDEVTMPADLLTAHQLNDRAVMEAYGFDLDMTESDIVSELMKMYKDLVEAEKNEENLNGEHEP